MKDETLAVNDSSPFHRGEREMQERVGNREATETIGRRVIRSYMPDQHREFFAQLPFMLVGSVDSSGWPWASFIIGRPGFIQSPDPKTLMVKANAIVGDPLGSQLFDGASVGLLGIELETRRRNRLNGQVSKSAGDEFEITVEHSFGNCPQYIQRRSVEFVREPTERITPDNNESFSSLDGEAQTLIEEADSFYVASAVQNEAKSDGYQVDVSHRGGCPGFVKVEGDTLTIPDYSGNGLFNTLGNFLVNPKAGITFADFTTGDLLMLTGAVELLWEDSPEVKAFKGAERGWRFHLEQGIRLRNALPFRFRFIDYSPQTLNTGDWQRADAVLSANQNGEKWRPYRVERIQDESSVIRSFYLKPADDGALPGFSAGQYLTVRLPADNGDKPIIRTYTLSSAPVDLHYRISVKREPNGAVSGYLHEKVRVGDTLYAKAPQGAFTIDASVRRPAVLLGAGVGITPMISMAQHLVSEGERTEYYRPVTVFQSAKTLAHRAFAIEFARLEHQSGGALRYHSFVSQSEAEEEPHQKGYQLGRINGEELRQKLALDDYDFYLCGPSGFMQSLYDDLRSLGVADNRIYAEAFGPAILQREKTEVAKQKAKHEGPNIETAEHAVINFVSSQFEQGWNKGDGTLLEFAEAHGLTPSFGCRSGSCGACAVPLKAGAVVYQQETTVKPNDGEVLICCAMPAKGSDSLTVDI